MANYFDPDNNIWHRVIFLTCQIRWVDDHGHATADTNPSIGRVQCAARAETIDGRRVQIDESPWYRICAEHARQLAEDGMEGWTFEAWP